MAIKINIFLGLLIILFFSLPSFSQVQIGTDIFGEGPYDRSGFSVSLSSDGARVAIGAYENDEIGMNAGKVKIYEWDGLDWTQLGEDINGNAADDNTGYSIALSSPGNILAIGSNKADAMGLNAGSSRIYEWDGQNWNQLGATIKGESPDDRSGHSIALSSNGTIVAIGELKHNGNGGDAGRVRIFKWNGQDWDQLGGNINGAETNDHLGHTLSLSDDGLRLAISPEGVIGSDEYVIAYEFNGQDWIQMGETLLGDGENLSFGYSVALSPDGTRIAIGATRGNDDNSGYVIIYEWIGGNWIPLGDSINGEIADDLFGNDVSFSLDGNRLATASSSLGSFEPDNYNGYAQMYEWDGQNWNKLGERLEGNTMSKVSLSDDGQTVAIGAPYYNGGFVAVFDFSALSGLNENENENENKIKIFPNPASQNLVISDLAYDFIEIIDNFGRLLIKEEQVNAPIDITKLPSGFYFIQIHFANTVYSSSFIKQ